MLPTSIKRMAEPVQISREPIRIKQYNCAPETDSQIASDAKRLYRRNNLRYTMRVGMGLLWEIDRVMADRSRSLDWKLKALDRIREKANSL